MSLDLMSLRKPSMFQYVKGRESGGARTLNFVWIERRIEFVGQDTIEIKVPTDARVEHTTKQCEVISQVGNNKETRNVLGEVISPFGDDKKDRYVVGAATTAAADAYLDVNVTHQADGTKDVACSADFDLKMTHSMLYPCDSDVFEGMNIAYATIEANEVLTFEMDERKQLNHLVLHGDNNPDERLHFTLFDDPELMALRRTMRAAVIGRLLIVTYQGFPGADGRIMRRWESVWENARSSDRWRRASNDQKETWQIENRGPMPMEVRLIELPQTPFLWWPRLSCFVTRVQLKEESSDEEYVMAMMDSRAAAGEHHVYTLPSSFDQLCDLLRRYKSDPARLTHEYKITPSLVIQQAGHVPLVSPRHPKIFQYVKGRELGGARTLDSVWVESAIEISCAPVRVFPCDNDGWVHHTDTQCEISYTSEEPIFYMRTGTHMRDVVEAATTAAANEHLDVHVARGVAGRGATEVTVSAPFAMKRTTSKLKRCDRELFEGMNIAYATLEAQESLEFDVHQVYSKLLMYDDKDQAEIDANPLSLPFILFDNPQLMARRHQMYGVFVKDKVGTSGLMIVTYQEGEHPVPFARPVERPVPFASTRRHQYQLKVTNRGKTPMDVRVIHVPDQPEQDRWTPGFWTTEVREEHGMYYNLWTLPSSFDQLCDLLRRYKSDPALLTVRYNITPALT